MYTDVVKQKYKEERNAKYYSSQCFEHGDKNIKETVFH